MRLSDATRILTECMKTGTAPNAAYETPTKEHLHSVAALEADLGRHQHGAAAGVRYVSPKRRRIVHEGHWIAEVSMIPQVDPIATQLELPSFCDRERLAEAEVPVRKSR